MRKLLLTFFLCIGILSLFPAADAATPPSANSTNPVQLVLDKLASLTVRDAQKLAGRKFTLKEKLSFWFLKQQIKQGQKKGFSNTLIYKALQKKTAKKSGPYKKEDAGSKGQTALIFGIGALALLVIGLFVPYVIIASLVSSILAIVIGTIAKKQNSSDSKASAGKLLGWITLGLIVLLIIAAAIALSGWGWG